MTSLRAHAGPELPVELKARVSGTDAHVLREPGVRHVGRADAEREAAERARHAGVRVGAGDELARERDLLDDLVVADGLQEPTSFPSRDLAVELHALLR